MISRQVLKESRKRISPWITLVERQINSSLINGDNEVEIYHSLDLADYVAIVARKQDGTFPVVRQYRPAINAFTWELPAGLVDTGEAPEETCRRELLEETGQLVTKILFYDSFLSDSGRLNNRLHVFAVECIESCDSREPEPGIEVAYWNEDDLIRAIRIGKFSHMLHIGSYLLALQAFK